MIRRSLDKIDVRDFGTNVRSIPHILEALVLKRAKFRLAPGLLAPAARCRIFDAGEAVSAPRGLDAVAPDHPVLIGFGAHVTLPTAGL